MPKKPTTPAPSLASIEEAISGAQAMQRETLETVRAIASAIRYTAQQADAARHYITRVSRDGIKVASIPASGSGRLTWGTDWERATGFRDRANADALVRAIKRKNGAYTILKVIL